VLWNPEKTAYRGLSTNGSNYRRLTCVDSTYSSWFFTAPSFYGVVRTGGTVCLCAAIRWCRCGRRFSSKSLTKRTSHRLGVREAPECDRRRGGGRSRARKSSSASLLGVRVNYESSRHKRRFWRANARPLPRRGRKNANRPFRCVLLGRPG